MPHWRSASGSWSGARPACLELALAAARSAAVSRSTSSLAARPPLGILPMGRLRSPRPGRTGGRRRGAVGIGDDVLAVGALELAGRLRHGGRPRLTGWAPLA